MGNKKLITSLTYFYPALTFTCFSLYNLFMYYVYFLQNENNELYYGSTNNLKRRLQEHNSGRTYYTKGRYWKLIYYEAYLSEKDARNRKKQLKLHGQAFAQTKRRIKNSLSTNLDN